MVQYVDQRYLVVERQKKFSLWSKRDKLSIGIYVFLLDIILLAGC